MGTADLLTLLVLNEVGPEASAVLLHGQHDRLHALPGDQQRRQRAGRRGRPRPGAGRGLARQALWNAARLVIPLAVVGVLLAPLVLGILGPDYAANGTVVLQLLLISAIPQLIVGIAIATARIRRDLRTDHGRLHRAGDRLDRGQLADPGPARPPRRGPGLPGHPAGRLLSPC